MFKFEITARHPVYGFVGFVLEAEDDKKAYSAWKQMVGNSRQWIIKSNTQVVAPLENVEDL